METIESGRKYDRIFFRRFFLCIVDLDERIVTIDKDKGKLV